ncbi:MAG: hypothetical protein Q8R47_05685 [Nanoarchaeota archaeon]|nr:hypothetical protein [Nanoarchaeota archaeon]
MKNLITEHSCKIDIELPPKDVHAQMEVFYNPVMKSNRNIAILLLNSVENEKMNIASPLAGSGIRELRFLKELEAGKIKNIFVNDIKENFPKVMAENLKLNAVKNDLRDKLIIHNDDANLFLLNQVKNCIGDEFCGYFDYIDIDPFGSPNPFLASAVARITREGIIAITATDTAALTGTYPKVTKRKYWAKAVRNYMMHEIGLRILIRKVQLQGVQFDKALIPILAYHKDHYFRIYFKCVKGKEKCDKILKEHQYLLFNPKTLEFTVSEFNQAEGFEYFGPLWKGNLSDKKLIAKMKKENPFPEEERFLDLLYQESKNDRVGFYDLHVIAKKYGLETTKLEPILKKVKGVRTQFSWTGIKTEKSVKEVVKVMKK